MNEFFCKLTCCGGGPPLIYRGTTPTLEFCTPFTADQVASAAVAFEQRGAFLFDKTCVIADEALAVELTVDDTLQFSELGLPLANVQLTVELTDGTIAKSNIMPFRVDREVSANG